MRKLIPKRCPHACNSSKVEIRHFSSEIEAYKDTDDTPTSMDTTAPNAGVDAFIEDMQGLDFLFAFQFRCLELQLMDGHVCVSPQGNNMLIWGHHLELLQSVPRE